MKPRSSASSPLVLIVALMSMALVGAFFTMPVHTSDSISTLAQWKTNMTTHGQQHCDYFLQRTPQQLMDEQHVYYDAERVFYQIADSDDPNNVALWMECARRAESVYRDHYVISSSDPDGFVPGFQNFTTGLRMDYERTLDPISNYAVSKLSENAAYAHKRPLNWTHGADCAREIAYAVLSYVNRRAVDPVGWLNTNAR